MDKNKIVKLLKTLGFSDNGFFYKHEDKENFYITYIFIYKELVSYRKDTGLGLGLAFDLNNNSCSFENTEDCINFIKEEFKHILRKDKIRKILNGNI